MYVDYNILSVSHFFVFFTTLNSHPHSIIVLLMLTSEFTFVTLVAVCLRVTIPFPLSEQMRPYSFQHTVFPSLQHRPATPINSNACINMGVSLHVDEDDQVTPDQTAFSKWASHVSDHCGWSGCLTSTNVDPTYLSGLAQMNLLFDKPVFEHWLRD